MFEHYETLFFFIKHSEVHHVIRGMLFYYILIFDIILEATHLKKTTTYDWLIPVANPENQWGVAVMFKNRFLRHNRGSIMSFLTFFTEKKWITRDWLTLTLIGISTVSFLLLFTYSFHTDDNDWSIELKQISIYHEGEYKHDDKGLGQAQYCLHWQQS